MVKFGSSARKPQKDQGKSSTWGCKQTLIHRLCPCGSKMCKKLCLVTRRILIGSFAETQTRRIFASGMRRGERSADAPSDRLLLHWARLAASNRAASSASLRWSSLLQSSLPHLRRSLCHQCCGCLICTRTGGRRLGFCAIINGIVSCARPALKVDRHCPCHCPHQRHLHSHPSPPCANA
jgi:hypothetical protein